MKRFLTRDLGPLPLNPAVGNLQLTYNAAITAAGDVAPRSNGDMTTVPDSVEIFETKVVDKIGYPRSVYCDNGSHFKKDFSAHLQKKAVTQNFAPISHPQLVGLAERYVQVVLNIYRAILQHHPDLIVQWDELLPTVIRSMNTRYIRTFGFTPAQLLLGFNPRFTKGADDFEDIIRSKAIDNSINELMTSEGFTVEEGGIHQGVLI